MAAKTKFETVDEYISSFPKDVQSGLEKFRKTIKKAVPGAEEVISYNIPAFKHNGFLVYFSAYTSHYSLSFPPPFGAFEVFKKELAPYQKSKSTIQFPMNEPLPLELIAGIAKLRVRENEEAAMKKKTKKK